MRGECGLCGNLDDLQVSHIIPKSIIKWLKEESPTRHIRHSEKPNARVQDGRKQPLLCAACEQRFGNWEKAFMEKLFRPYTDQALDRDGFLRKPPPYKHLLYDDWLLKFAISIQWRVAYTSPKKPDNAETARLLDETLQVWKDFLAERRADTGRTSTYLAFLNSTIADEIVADGNGLPPNIHAYLHGTIDQTLFMGPGKRLSILSKLGPVALWTTIRPAEEKKLGDKRVKLRGAFPYRQYFGNPRFNTLLFRLRPPEVASTMLVSQKQASKIDQAMKRDLPYAQSRRGFRAATTDSLRNRGSRKK